MKSHGFRGSDVTFSVVVSLSPSCEQVVPEIQWFKAKRNPFATTLSHWR